MNYKKEYEEATSSVVVLAIISLGLLIAFLVSLGFYFEAHKELSQCQENLKYYEEQNPYAWHCVNMTQERTDVPRKYWDFQVCGYLTEEQFRRAEKEASAEKRGNTK